MAITLRASTKQTVNSASPTVPANSPGIGAYLDNISIIAVLCTGSITVVPSNLVQLGSTFALDATRNMYLYRHSHLGAAEPSSFVFTSDTSGRGTAHNFEFEGLDETGTTVLDVINTPTANASSTTVTATGVNPNYTNDLLIWFGGALATGATWATPTNFTADATDSNNEAANTLSSGFFYQILTVGTATGDLTTTIDVAAVNGAFLVALRDASPIAESMSVNAPVSTATAMALVPNVPNVPILLAAPVSTATALAHGPEVVIATLSVKLTGGNVQSPFYGRTYETGEVGTPIGPFVPAATALAPVPTVRLSASVPLSTASAATLTPGALLSASTPLSTATATAIVPTVTSGAIVVSAPTATATAQALIPSIPVLLAAPTATATATAIAPTVPVRVAAPLSTATAQAIAPNVPVRIAAPLTTATSGAFVPVVFYGVIILPGASLATATAYIPTVYVTGSIPMGTDVHGAFRERETIGSPRERETVGTLTRR